MPPGPQSIERGTFGIIQRNQQRTPNTMEDNMSYIEEIFGLFDKVIVITGGGGVLAGSIAEAFLKAGATVSLWGRGHESLDDAIKRLSASTGFEHNLHTVVVDTTVESQVGKALSITEKEIGVPEVLINGAGGTRGKSSFIEIDINLFEEVLRLNLIAGLVVPTKVIARRWIEKDVKGSIVNIASMSSYIPLSGVWAYDAAKAGVLNLTMACAKEFASHNIRVNAIAPGFFLAKHNRALLIDDKTGDLTERGKTVIERTPFGRFGVASDLEGAVLFLASNRASGFVTGISIPIDGGFLIDTI